ncbi:MAG: PAS domain-containing protein, partial [bacterium]|nr:PAS domain-containing protein [bacterium]
ENPMSFLDAVHPEDREIVRKGMERMEQGEMFDEEYRIIRPDGELRWVKARTFPILDEHGSPDRYVGIVEDRTEVRWTEEVLLNTVRHARCLLWTATVEERDTEPSGKLHWAYHLVDEEAAQVFLPLPIEAGKNYMDILARGVVSENLEQMDRISYQALKSGQASYSQEYRWKMVEGDIRWMFEDVHIAPAGPGRWEVVGVTTDITNLKRNEEALARQVQEKEVLLEIGQAVQELAAPGELEQMARVCFEQLKRLGVNFQALAIQRVVDDVEGRFEAYRISSSGQSCRDVVVAPNLFQVWKSGIPKLRKDLDADLEDLPQSVVQTMRERLGIHVRCILDLPHAKGNMGLLSTLSDAFSEADIRLAEQVSRVLSVGMARAEDLERLEMRNKALQESEGKYRAILEAQPDMIFLLSGDGVFLNFYAHDMSTLLMAPSEFLGKRVVDVMPGDVANQIMVAIQQCLANGQMKMFEYELLVPTQERHFFEARMVVQGQYEVLAIIRDVTEFKQAEREMVRLERLRALGELSAGISHNLNNILTGIMGPAQLLQRYSGDEQLRVDVEDILKSAERARDLVHRLHQAVRGEDDREVHPVLVGSVVLQAVNDTRPRWKDEAEIRGSVIRVEQDVAEGLEIAGTVSGLYDLLVNLLLNAVDAMPDGGCISISAREMEQGVQLVVRDTGIGMDDEVRKRVFEPFFTTKMNVGTGLGLSTVYGTVERWDGRIEVESVPGEGSTFTLWLPAWTDAVPEKVPQAEVLASRRGSILIVDDDENVGRLLERVLSKVHDVEVFLSGSDALAKFEPGQYDVALVDLGLPDLPGNRLVQEMRQRDPELVAVVITGWQLQETDPRYAAFDFHLGKPFADIHEVRGVVAEAVVLHDQKAGGKG